MADLKLENSPVLREILFSAAAFGVAGLSVFASWKLYAAAGKSPADFCAKLGEFSLQLAVVVIVGAFVKLIVDWGTSQRARHAERLEIKKEFMRRVRAMHVSIQNARALMIAHGSAKTWGEQSRRLMALIPEIEEISEDLKTSGNLFRKNEEVIDGLEKIISYLQGARDEYVRCHDAVDHGYKSGKALRQIIKEENMTWVRDFMEGSEDYKSNYEANLTQSKGAMRSEIFLL